MNLAPQVFRDRATRERWSHKVRNTPARYRGAKTLVGAAVARKFGVPTMISELRAVKTCADGTVIDYGVISRRVVTTVGVNFLATAFINTVEPEVINFHDSGTSGTAEAIGDTTITAGGPARVAGTQSNPSANVYRSAATVNYTTTLSIVEHGLFTASSSGTLWDRSVFTSIGVVNGDSILFTYSLTLTAGG